MPTEVRDTNDNSETLAAAALRHVREMLQAHGGNKSRAAKALGISRRSLYRWLARGEEQ